MARDRTVATFSEADIMAGVAHPAFVNLRIARRALDLVHAATQH
jgi:hypothetical protein